MDFRTLLYLFLNIILQSKISEATNKTACTDYIRWCELQAGNNSEAVKLIIPHNGTGLLTCTSSDHDLHMIQLVDSRDQLRIDVALDLYGGWLDGNATLKDTLLVSVLWIPKNDTRRNMDLLQCKAVYGEWPFHCLTKNVKLEYDPVPLTSSTEPNNSPITTDSEQANCTCNSSAPIISSGQLLRVNTYYLVFSTLMILLRNNVIIVSGFL